MNGKVLIAFVAVAALAGGMRSASATTSDLKSAGIVSAETETQNWWYDGTVVTVSKKGRQWSHPVCGRVEAENRWWAMHQAEKDARAYVNAIWGPLGHRIVSVDVTVKKR